jgi:chromatin remodeling complex protein RSC6
MKKAPAKRKAKKATKKKATKKATKKKTTKKKVVRKATKKVAKKATRKKATKKVTKKKATKKVVKKVKPKVKRKPNPAFMAPMAPDAVLGAVVGDKPMPRTEITKRLWDYIKKHSLQDKVNRRMINCDGALRSLFGKGVVSMFEMNKLLQAHLKKA